MGGEPHEIEKQWVARGALELPDEVGRFRAAEREQRLIVDTYLDTAAGAFHGELAAAGATLRLREQDGARLATFKQRLDGDSPELRRRREVEGPVGDDQEASDAFRAARALTDAPLVELGRLENRRTVRVYAGPAGEVEVVLDALTYPDGSHEWRVEAEGPEEAVAVLAPALADALGGLEPAQTGKLGELLRRLPETGD